MKPGTLTGDGRAKVRWKVQGEKIGISDKLFTEKGCVRANYTFTEFQIPSDYCNKCDKIIIDAHLSK